MKKNTSILLLRTISSILLLSLFLIIVYAFVITKKSTNIEVNHSNENNIPIIKEEYDYSLLNVYTSNTGNIYYDKDSDEIRVIESDTKDYHIIGKFGKLYDKYENVYAESENKIKDYTIYYDKKNFNYYYINSKNNYISNNYSLIKPIYYEKNNEIICDYFILENKTSENIHIFLLNINKDEILELDNEITYIGNINPDYDKNDYYNPNYLVIANNKDKYGIMDYNGNITSIFTFDNILRTSNNDLFIAKYNNKYGLINHKNETKLQFQYDYIYIYGDYILTIKDNLLSIYNNKYKEIVKDIKVYIPDKDFYDYESETKFNVFLYADNLYIKLFSNKNDEEYTNYLVNKKGIQKSITGDATPIYKNGIIKFFYTEKLNDGKIELNIYDLDFIEYYNLNISCDYGDYTFDIDNIINTNNYMISINYHYKDKDDLKVYYIDLFNSREINEFDAIYNYLDNGYGFVLDTNNDLKVYKNEKILDTFNNIDGYLGDYYFYSNIYNKYAIYKLEFKKGSKYVK